MCLERPSETIAGSRLDTADLTCSTPTPPPPPLPPRDDWCRNPLNHIQIHISYCITAQWHKSVHSGDWCTLWLGTTPRRHKDNEQGKALHSTPLHLMWVLSFTLRLSYLRRNLPQYPLHRRLAGPLQHVWAWCRKKHSCLCLQLSPCGPVHVQPL
jgi:hypothetical protein